MSYLSRRHLLLGAGATGFAGALGGLSGLGHSRAWAADTSGYKAMVCIFLYGGMDQSDTLLPYDTAEYDLLSQTAREGLFSAYGSDQATSSRHRDNLLPLQPAGPDITGGRQFALPQELAPFHAMFQDGDLAIVGNVGPLIEPTTRAGMDSGTAILPKRLFSHNDQQSTWMSLSTEGARFGWGGLFLDAVAASAPGQSNQFASISTGSNDVFLSGAGITPFRVTGEGAVLPNLVELDYYLGQTERDDDARAAIRALLARTDLGDNNIYAGDLRRTMSRSIENSEQMLAARQNTLPFNTVFADDSVSQQLKAAAETIRAQQFLNVSRQIFFVSTGGYDTHSAQAQTIGRLHANLANGIASFRQAMLEIGRWNDVVAFTASDFGRTQIDNGDGTDHGWGGHHFVAGGGVQGGRLYGNFPEADPTSLDYTSNRGRMIPQVSVEQYAATIGRWFGLDPSEINGVLPNLANFNSSDLGFLSSPII